MAEETQQRLVTVLEPRNHGEVAVAKSILDGSDIPYFVRGEATNQMWGVRLLAEGVEVQVPAEYAEDARALLEPLSR